MAETETPVPDDDNPKQNEINIFKISSFPTDDTLTKRLKSRNLSKMYDYDANATYRSVSHDRYLD